MSSNERPPQHSQKPLRKNPHLGHQHPSRPLYTPPGVDKALHFFGVPDLRDLLNKKHEEQGQTEGKSPRGKPPPSDPTYNYLKDPLRDPNSVNEENFAQKSDTIKGKPHHPSNRGRYHPQNEHFKKQKDRKPHQNNPPTHPTSSDDLGAEGTKENSENFNIDEHPSTSKYDSHPKTRGTRGHTHRGRGGPRPPRAQEVIKNPKNIKIELSTSTGERNCVLDEDTTIADIKHVPDKRPLPTRGRGRGRGRGGPQKYWGRPQRQFNKTGGGNNENQIEVAGQEEADKEPIEEEEEKIGEIEDVKDYETLDSVVGGEFEEETNHEALSSGVVREFEDERNDETLNSEVLDNENAETGKNYESELVKNLQENVVITAGDGSVSRSVEVLQKNE